MFRGESWRVEFPSVRLLKAHEEPFCKCCHQRLPLRALEPVFMYCQGENTGYYPCSADDVIGRWGKQPHDVAALIDEEDPRFVCQPMHVRPETAELLLWTFGYAVRPNMEQDVLEQARKWLDLATTTSVRSWGIEQSLRYTEYRKVYAEWTFRRVKTLLREMKRAGRVPATMKVR